MAKDCGHNVPCGCGDKALTTPPPCNASDACEGESCAELFSDACIVHTGNTFRVPGPNGEVIVYNGERLSAILEKLVLAAQGFKNEDPATGLVVKTQTADSVTISFYGSAVAYDCEIEDLDTAGTTIVSATQVATTPQPKWEVTFTGLVSNALDYTHSVTITDPATGAESVVLLLNI